MKYSSRSPPHFSNVQVIVVPWLLNGYGDCTTRRLMMSFQGRSPRKDIINLRMVQHHTIKKGDYKHWTWDPRTEDPRIGTQRSSSVALSFYDRIATGSKLKLMAVSLWVRVHIFILTVDALLTRLCYFTLR